jgi:hypothetical protein
MRQRISGIVGKPRWIAVRRRAPDSFCSVYRTRRGEAKLATGPGTLLPPCTGSYGGASHARIGLHNNQGQACPWSAGNTPRSSNAVRGRRRVPPTSFRHARKPDSRRALRRRTGYDGSAANVRGRCRRSKAARSAPSRLIADLSTPHRQRRRPCLGWQLIGQGQGIGLLQAFVRQRAQRMTGSRHQHVGVLARFEHAAETGVGPKECASASTNAQGAPASSAAAIISAAIAGLV